MPRQGRDIPGCMTTVLFLCKFWGNIMPIGMLVNYASIQTQARLSLYPTDKISRYADMLPNHFLIRLFLSLFSSIASSSTTALSLNLPTHFGGPLSLTHFSCALIQYSCSIVRSLQALAYQSCHSLWSHPHLLPHFSLIFSTKPSSSVFAQAEQRVSCGRKPEIGVR